MRGRLQHPFDYRVDCAAISHLGLVRADNEDAWHSSPEDGCFIVADGMGGHAAGEIASALTVQAVAKALRTSEPILRSFVAAPTLEARREVFGAMRAAAAHAHETVLAEGIRKPELAGMGSTLDVVLLVGSRAFVLHVGDGRVYLARPDVTVQLTNDHDIRAVLGMQGSIPPPARTNVPNRLLNAIGLGIVIPDCVSFDVAVGDRIVLCTDGVHQMINDEVAMGKRAGSAAVAARGLIDAALAKGGRDNATALVVDVHEALLEGELGPRSASPTRDLEVTLESPLLHGVARPMALRLLSAAIDVELPEGRIPRIVARDRVAYIVLGGEVRRSDGTSLGAGAFLYAESLLDARRPTTYEAIGTVRATRLRADDFRELCSADLRLAATLYEQLARHLAHIDR